MINKIKKKKKLSFLFFLSCLAFLPHNINRILSIDTRGGK